MYLKRRSLYNGERNILSHAMVKATKLIILAIIAFFILWYSVAASGMADNNPKLATQIEAVIIGPTPGEYDYEVKLIKDQAGKPINPYYTNSNKANILGVIDKLKKDYPNLKKVGLMIGWYGNTTHAGKIHILPKVQNRHGPNWQVAGYNRTSAKLVSKDSKGQPNWTGTPTDQSIVELSQRLKQLGLKVTLYPTLFIDTPEKPWRGEVTARIDADVLHFFKEYDKFILHYASLTHNGIRLKDVIDGFIIGSELEGLTKYENQVNTFPAVDQLVSLAEKARKALGAKVSISYAANWSEYHHSDNGWHHLDKLWMDPNINFIGINGYFPLTSHLNDHDECNIAQIQEGWESGEAYDYYIEDRDKKELKPEWAVANFEYWWKNRHLNPDGSYSLWVPKAKPIVFTELGFTAINKTTHEPYRYLDVANPITSLPKGSDGTVDTKYQYDAIRATTNFIRELLSRPGNNDMTLDIFWYNIDPKGRSKHWQHNHEIKVAEFEKGENLLQRKKITELINEEDE